MSEVLAMVRDVASVALFAVGALLALVASIGLHRLGDTRARMHAATKPATLGVVCCGLAAGLQLAYFSDVTKIVVIVLLQLVTAPVGAHVLGRAVGEDGDGGGVS
jgi:multicomponent Na+:H+ antiporter subunit G